MNPFASRHLRSGPRPNSRLLLAGALALSIAGCSRQEPPAPAAAPRAPPAPAAATPEPCRLNLFIWSEYIDPDLVRQFEARTGCTVAIDLYEDNESMLARLQGDGAGRYDVVVPGNYVVPAMVKAGLLAPLRREHLPNLANLDEKFTNPAYDPGNRYTAAYQWGTLGIYLRRKAGGPADETWGLVLDPKKGAGAFVLIDSIREMIGAVARYEGRSVNTTDPGDLEVIGRTLAAAKARAAGFDGGVGGKNKVLSHAADVAVVYNGDAVKGMKADPDTRFFVPREGSIVWVDSLAIPARAPHRELAERFIDFLLEPGPGAQLAHFNQYATPNKAARRLASPQDLNNPAIYPPPEIMSKLEFVEDLGERGNRRYDELWTRVKSRK